MNVKPEDRLQWFCDLHHKFEKGIMMTTSSFAIANINIYKPHHLAVIFSSKQNITKSFEYDHLETWLGKALLTGTGDKWFHERKIITPSFHFGILDQFTAVITDKAQILNLIIEEKIKANPEEPVEFFEISIRCALDIILETAIGVNMNIQRNHQTEYMSALHKTKIGSEFKSSVDTMTNFTMKIIKKKQQARKAISNGFTKKKDELGERRKKAFLDLMLDINENEKNPMTDTELREQVDTFLFAVSHSKKEILK
ncbi:cytochrome P450 4C1-like isoform X2 [Belonocnema kinseyi]|uniref:cytochrome P450 4C1-like isoform X2 n=1 Tax=Belonocnema kinseyi TaxID=2817044 RepID=UPI00143D5289|nr:cytochrome P450 4C1-like isoform X2 [Belonocnema kinseyi]